MNFSKIISKLLQLPIHSNDIQKLEFNICAATFRKPTLLFTPRNLFLIQFKSDQIYVIWISPVGPDVLKNLLKRKERMKGRER